MPNIENWDRKWADCIDVATRNLDDYFEYDFTVVRSVVVMLIRIMRVWFIFQQKNSKDVDWLGWSELLINLLWCIFVDHLLRISMNCYFNIYRWIRVHVGLEIRRETKFGFDQRCKIVLHQSTRAFYSIAVSIRGYKSRRMHRETMCGIWNCIWRGTLVAGQGK